MRTFLLQNKDLVVGSNSYVEVTGPGKVYQDISIALQETYGANRFHPNWGSILNSMIGSALSQSTTTVISSEVTRVLKNYMLNQQNTISNYNTQGLPSPYNNSDLVVNMTPVQITSIQDSVGVSFDVSTISQSAIPVAVNVSS
jgi:hypothetical protein